MARPEHGDASPDRAERSKLPSKRTLGAFFAVGAILLVAPMALVFFWTPDPTCTHSAQRASLCNSEIYNRTISFLPFVMLAGGAMIAFNMKRISDANKVLSEEE
jgi:hypothetical protein